MKEKEIVKFWIEEVIIGLNLCPFARAPYEKGLLNLNVCIFLEEEKRTHYFFDVLERVVMHPDDDFNAVVAFPRVLDEFHDFYDWVSFLDDLIKRQKLPVEVQLITFHPDFTFDQSQEVIHPRAHLVNSSPYPAIHLLKAKAISNVLVDPKDGEKISRMNEEKLKALSLNELKAKFFWKKDLF